jgi:hypothetical protein
VQLPLQSGLPLMQTTWKAILDPVLANPTTNPVILKNIVIKTGNNQIPHLLQRVQQGWIVIDMSGSGAMIYRYQAFNNIFLYLTSSADTTVSLAVF